jgi:2,5-dioxopentanoate dehydrogenase
MGIDARNRTISLLRDGARFAVFVQSDGEQPYFQYPTERGAVLSLQGVSLIGSEKSSAPGARFHAFDPATGEKLQPEYYSAGSADVDRAAEKAAQAFGSLASLSGSAKAELLNRVAAAIEARGNEIVERAKRETGLPEPRLRSELARTANQLRLFASVVQEGSWVNARIDPAQPERKPLPRADIRSMLRPLGPVAVFGASNFPLAFSVAGGDTASALAAGNPVIVKAHPAHPGTSELVGDAVRESVAASGLHDGVFSLLFDAGIEVGQRIVGHPLVQAVGFTGSAAAGQALMRIANSRPQPIAVFAEMGSVNPLFVLPGAMRARGTAIAAGLLNSFTLGSGQMCTKPGLVFVPPGAESSPFRDALKEGVRAMQPQMMLTRGIADRYSAAIQARMNGKQPPLAAVSAPPQGAGCAQAVALFECEAASLLRDPELAREVFGPSTLLIDYDSGEELLSSARALEGHLTAAIHGTEEDLETHRELIAVLQTKVGRLIFNGFPTGVEVCNAMVHGGPWPATSDGRSSSVGTLAVFRFARPFCYQDFPDSALPEELKDSNPLGIWRMVDGSMTRDAVQRAG